MNSCIKRVGGDLLCTKCKGKIGKHGKLNARQRYKYNGCKSTFMGSHQYITYDPLNINI